MRERRKDIAGKEEEGGDQMLCVSVGQHKEPGFPTVHSEKPLRKGPCHYRLSNALPGCSVEKNVGKGGVMAEGASGCAGRGLRVAKEPRQWGRGHWRHCVS